MSNLKPTLSFEQGWPILQEEAINKVILLVEEGHTSNQFTSEEYMHLYTYPIFILLLYYPLIQNLKFI